jgi:hypothetical protein
LAAAASWVIWPILYYVGYWIIGLGLALGRRCGLEGCDPPDGFLGALWWLGMLAVPALLTYRWIRWRRSRQR